MHRARALMQEIFVRLPIEDWHKPLGFDDPERPQ
jgi:hypothetical protein